MTELKLEEAAPEHAQRAMAYRQEFIDFGETHIQGCCDLIHYTDYFEWLAAVARVKKADTSPLGVAATTYFSVHQGDGRIIGTVQLRHTLSEELIRGGGHIGYAVRPTERGKGYGKQQLLLVLAQAEQLGVKRVMVSCEKRNAASAAVIRACGGVLAWEGFSDLFHTCIQTYWINRGIKR